MSSQEVTLQTVALGKDKKIVVLQIVPSGAF